jgi:hypothetical protein
MADQNIKVKIDLDVADFNKHAKELSDAISKVLGRDIDLFNGKLRQTAQTAQQAGAALGNAGKAANTAGADAKKANIQWTNLSLIIQDLPYGIRGIQNNLPALAAGMGGVYFAISAVVAVLTAMDMGLISFGSKVKLNTDYNKEYASSLAEQKVKLDGLYGIATNVNRSMEDRVTAAKKLKEEYPKLLSNFSAEEIAAGKAVDAYNKLSEAVIRYAKAEAAQTAIKEIVTKQIENDLKIAKLTLDQKDANLSADKKQADIDKKSLVYAAGTINLERVRASTIGDNINKLKLQNKTLEDQLKKYTDIYSLNADFDLDKQTGGAPKLNQDTSLLDRLKKEQKLYKDNLGMFYHYGSLIIKEEERLAIERANFEKASAEEIKNIRSGFLADMIVNQQEYGRAIMSEAEKNTKAYEEIERKIGEIIVKNREDIADALGKINADVNKENIKNVTDELGVTLNATRRNYRAQKDAYEMSIAKLKEKKAALEEAGIATTGYAEAIANLETRMSGLVDPLESLSQQLQTIFDNLKIDLLVSFGEALGTALTGGEFDLTKLATILADALSSIGKALITYAILSGAAMETLKDPTKWPIALAAGILAVAAGAALKSKISQQKTTKFANGGIVSGPTMGLVGEYPGAKSNPEVIAPLDKLKSMIGGGGGGTFVLRGQDLLLATNRAQKASNLKGQNISLA